MRNMAGTAPYLVRLFSFLSLPIGLLFFSHGGQLESFAIMHERKWSLFQRQAGEMVFSFCLPNNQRMCAE